jgi:hypothetical protein
MLILENPDKAPAELKQFIPNGAKWYALYEITPNQIDYAYYRGLLNRLLPMNIREVQGKPLGLKDQTYLFAVGMT